MRLSDIRTRVLAATGRVDRVRLLLTLAVFVTYAVYSVSRYSQLLPAGYDLGIFDQAVHDYSRFRAPMVELKGPGFNLLGDHFHPILVVLAPLYWLWDDPRTLLIAQAALLAVSVAIVHRFAQRHAGGRWAFVVATAYALGWPIQGMADFDFHEIAFAVPLLAWAVDALDRRSDRELVASCLLLLLVREDMGLVVLLFGLIRLPYRPRWVAGALVASGVVGYIVATEIVLPGLSPTGKFAYWSYGGLGPDLPSAVRALVFDPIDSARLFFRPAVKTHTLLWLFAPLLFLPLRSPYVIPALPLLAQRFFSSRDHLWTVEFHYSAVLWPLLFLAALDGARRLGVHRWLIRRRAAGTWALAAVLASVSVVGTAINADMWPLKRLIRGVAFSTAPHMADQRAILRSVPASTCVEADDRLAVQLTHSNRVSLPGLLGAAPDFYALDMSQAEVGYTLPSPATVRQAAEANGYVAVATHGDVVLLQSPVYAGPSTSCAP